MTSKSCYQRQPIWTNTGDNLRPVLRGVSWNQEPANTSSQTMAMVIVSPTSSSVLHEFVNLLHDLLRLQGVLRLKIVSFRLIASPDHQL